MEPSGDLEIDPHQHGDLSFERGKKEFNGARIFFITSGVGKLVVYIYIRTST